MMKDWEENQCKRPDKSLVLSNRDWMSLSSLRLAAFNETKAATTVMVCVQIDDSQNQRRKQRFQVDKLHAGFILLTQVLQGHSWGLSLTASVFSGAATWELAEQAGPEAQLCPAWFWAGALPAYRRLNILAFSQWKLDQSMGFK